MGFLLRRRGVIINVSSIGARIAGPGIDYGVAKAGLTNLTKALSEEYAPRGLRAVTVSPGPTRTGMWTDPNRPAGDLARSLGTELDHLVAGLPQQMGLSIGRLAEPEETAATIAFLASPWPAPSPGPTSSSTEEPSRPCDARRLSTNSQLALTCAEDTRRRAEGNMQ